jgi:hypothetical protein
MSSSHTLSAFDFAAGVPAGWDVRITGPTTGPSGAVGYPLIHAANFALPARREQYGQAVVAAMTSNQIFVAVIGFGPASPADPATAPTGLFATAGLPRPLQSDWFDPYQMQRPRPGMAGMQRFFTTKGKRYCLYVVIGSYAGRPTQVALVNGYLDGLTIQGGP